MSSKEIKKIIEEFFNKMSWEEMPANIKIKDNTVSFDIKTETPEILIGKKGQILSDIQFLLAKMLSKKAEDKIFVDCDINDYKKKKTDYLNEVARNTADEVILTRKEKSLEPMTPFERRIIHMALSERTDVESESQGQGEDRRVIIRPT